MRQRLFRLLVALLRKWVRPTILDAEAVPGAERPPCYVLARPSTLDLAALAMACEAQGLPSPERDAEGQPRHFALASNEGLFGQRPSMGRRRRELREYVAAARRGAPVTLVPVSVFWGRAPDRERSMLGLLVSERWTATSGLRRVLGVLFDRTHLFVRFGAPVRVADELGPGQDAALAERRLARVLRTSLRHHREALIGPDLSHRRTLVRDVVASRAVRRAAAEHAEREGVPASRAVRRARDYANEIASDISFLAVRFFDVMLTWLWTRLYDGIEVRGLDGVKALAGDHTLVYVPSHRSHMDYLLLSYVLFYNGLMLPHIAAGRNLNIPVVGPLLRRAGAFFMRRSFRGDPLYAAVFESYLDRVFASGSSVEYFIEGGRTRTGRLLPAKAGMLAMTLRSFLRGTRRPIVFVPVYFGYEKVVEARSYVGELRGQAKRSESLGGIVRSARFLRQSFGTVHVSFGEPLLLEPALAAAAPDWSQERAAALAGEAPWFQPFVASLGEQLQVRTNEAATITPVALLATALLATERQALDETTLEAQLDCLLFLAQRFGAHTATTDADGASIIRYGEQLGLLGRTHDELGDLISLGPLDTVLLTWYRNNTVHVFALPSLLAVLLAPGRSVSRERLRADARFVLPALCAELYMDTSVAEQRLEDALEALISLGLVRADGRRLRAAPLGSAEHGLLHRLSLVVMPTLERYFIALRLLTHAEQRWEAESFESACEQTARRVARLYRIDAPEFFDRALFRGFVTALERQGVVHRDGDHLTATTDLRGVLIAARRVLDPVFCEGVRAVAEQARLKAEVAA